MSIAAKCPRCDFWVHDGPCLIEAPDKAVMHDSLLSALDDNQRLRAAVLRQVENIERWRETGIPADADESRSIYEQLCAAIGRTPVS
jgi:hypothetical protein